MPLRGNDVFLETQELPTESRNPKLCLLSPPTRGKTSSHRTLLQPCSLWFFNKPEGRVSARKTGSQNRISLQCRKQLRPVASTVVSKTEYITCQTFFLGSDQGPLRCGRACCIADVPPLLALPSCGLGINNNDHTSFPFSRGCKTEHLSHYDLHVYKRFE